jgi:hypothetical protein
MHPQLRIQIPDCYGFSHPAEAAGDICANSNTAIARIGDSAGDCVSETPVPILRRQRVLGGKGAERGNEAIGQPPDSQIGGITRILSGSITKRSLQSAQISLYSPHSYDTTS